LTIFNNCDKTLQFTKHIFNVKPILKIQNLNTGYGKKQILHNVNLEIAAGEVVLIAGANGSGKSTLLKAIYGLLPAWNADAHIVFNPDSNGPSFDTHLPALNLQRGLAYVPQKNAVFEDLTVRENLELAGDCIRDKDEFSRRLAEVFSMLPTLTKLTRNIPQKMSGGERQILAIGMTLLHRPSVLLLDEPTASLSPQALFLVLDHLRCLHETSKLTMLIVEHRVRECLGLANRVVGLKLGVVAMDQQIKKDFQSEQLRAIFV
jgi:branched-chain amino acid transport system ATP-binding protein